MDRVRQRRSTWSLVLAGIFFAAQGSTATATVIDLREAVTTPGALPLDVGRHTATAVGVLMGRIIEEPGYVVYFRVRRLDTDTPQEGLLVPMNGWVWRLEPGSYEFYAWEASKEIVKDGRRVMRRSQPLPLTPAAFTVEPGKGIYLGHWVIAQTENADGSLTIQVRIEDRLEADRSLIRGRDYNLIKGIEGMTPLSPALALPPPAR